MRMREKKDGELSRITVRILRIFRKSPLPILGECDLCDPVSCSKRSALEPSLVTDLRLSLPGDQTHPCV